MPLLAGRSKMPLCLLRVLVILTPFFSCVSVFLSVPANRGLSKHIHLPGTPPPFYILISENLILTNILVLQYLQYYKLTETEALTLQFVIVHFYSISRRFPKSPRGARFDKSLQFAGRNQHTAADLDGPKLSSFNQIVQAANRQRRSCSSFPFRICQ